MRYLEGGSHGFPDRHGNGFGHVARGLRGLFYRRADDPGLPPLFRLVRRGGGASVPRLRALRQDQVGVERAGTPVPHREPGLAGAAREFFRRCARGRPAPGPGIPAQPAGQFRGGRADGHRGLVRNVDQRPGRLSFQERRSTRFTARQCEQRDRAQLEQPETVEHAGRPPFDEHAGAR